MISKDPQESFRIELENVYCSETDDQLPDQEVIRTLIRRDRIDIETWD
jgi:hypothetical protein